MLGSLSSCGCWRVRNSDSRINLSSMLDGGRGWALMFLTLGVLQYPGVVLDLVEGVALFRVEGQDVLDEVSHLGGEVVWEFQVNVFDPLVGLVVVVRLEGREAAAKLKTQDPETPNVDSLIVRLLYHHLRGEVVKCAAKGLPAIVRRVDTPPEICNFDCAL